MFLTQVVFSDFAWVEDIFCTNMETENIPSLDWEEWRDIPWYDWKYLASSYWRIYSIWTKPSIKSRWRMMPWRKWRLLKWRKWGNYWHLYVKLLWRNISVHRLVASAFLWLDLNSFINPKTSLCVCHKDDNPWNNRYDNLFLWTNKDNHNDMMNKKRRIFKSGIENPLYGKPWIMLWKFGKEHHLSKVVYQYKDWILIGKYYWIRYAGRITWVNFWDISKCCKWKAKSAWWFQWSYAYVWDRNVAEQSWINNVSIFLQ